jgi:hypothetical protein
MKFSKGLNFPPATVVKSRGTIFASLMSALLSNQGVPMGNGVINEPYKGALDNSLSAIKQAHRQLRLATGTATPTVLTLQIKLCGTLLEEITDVRSNLVAYLECTRPREQRPKQLECTSGDLLQEDSSV